MTAASRPQICSRAWEVAAARDGRLLSKDLDSLRRHLATCEDCSEEQRRLEALSAGLRQLPPLPDDLLAARRLRHRLLADTHRWVTGSSPAQRRPVRAFVLGGLAVALLGVLGYVAFSRHAALPPLAATKVTLPAPRGQVQVEISAGTGSIWRKILLGEQLRIELDSGEISAKIGPRRAGQGVRIQLPDGQIEDLGTVLSVRVENQRTTSIRVTEGRVRVQLSEQEPFELGAGEGWSRAVDERRDETSPARVSKAAPLVADEASQKTRSVPTAPTGSTARAATPPSGSAALASDPTPRSAREEDEAYLHIVALANAHQMSDARAAAKDYLSRFPSGFRRAEVLEVATH